MKNSCVELSVYSEKVYRSFLEIIRHELEKLNVADINSIQAFILMNINENVVTVSEILSRGYYIGSNASYNIKKMIGNGYVVQTPSDYDRRAAFLQLTPKGLNLFAKLDNALVAHSDKLEKNLKKKSAFNSGLSFLKNIDAVLKDVLSSSRF